MDTAEASLALLEELKRLRGEGLREIYLEEDTLLGLEKALGVPSVNKAKGISTVSPDQPLAGKPPTPVVLNPSSDNKETKSIQVEGLSNSAVNIEKFQSTPELTLPEGDKRTQWAWLKGEVENCSVANSELNDGSKILFGRGSLDAELFFCGEAPSEEDDLAGSVFGGQVGELLTKIIEAMGYSASTVYYSNILHWRPKYEMSFGHRPPTEAEMRFSLPYLLAQIDIIKPKVIIALGKNATDGFLGSDPKRRLGDVRGNWKDFSGVPLMVTYHPSYLLHNPSKSSKRKVWEDMLKVMERVGAKITEKQKGFFL